MKLYEVFKQLEKSRLCEGLKDDVWKLFPQELFQVNDENDPLDSKHIKDSIQQQINWAISVLKRKDRIVWFLRIIRYNLLDSLIKNSGSFKGEPTFSEQAIQKFKKIIQDSERNFGIKDYNTNRLKSELEHCLSLGIAKIDNIVFDKQPISELFGMMGDIEQAWKSERKQVIKPGDILDNDHEVIMKFSDGKFWLNLNTNRCDREGSSMGHCGNGGSYDSNETILSLREPSSGGQRPLLTFILNEKTGKLGEMKGRNNDKPAEKYHPYIVALLKLPMIVDIMGGGYKPENNFNFNDLSKEDQDAVASENLSVCSTTYLYNKFGMKGPIKAKVDRFLNQSSIFYDKSTNTYEFFASSGEIRQSGSMIGKAMGKELIDTIIRIARIEDDDRYTRQIENWAKNINDGLKEFKYKPNITFKLKFPVTVETLKNLPIFKPVYYLTEPEMVALTDEEYLNDGDYIYDFERFLRQAFHDED